MVFLADGLVDIKNSIIERCLECTQGHFRNPGQIALNVGGASIGNYLMLRDGFLAEGQVYLQDTKMGLSLNCNGGRFINPGGTAIMGSGVQVGGSVYLGNGFVAQGKTDFRGLSAVRSVDCGGGKFFNAGEIALSFNSGHIGSSLFLRRGFVAEGRVILIAIKVGRVVDCSGGEFKNPQKIAINATRIRVQASILLSSGFKCEGKVFLAGARIAINLHCDGGSFTNGLEAALDVVGAEIGGSIHLRHGFRAIGWVDLRHLTLGRSLDCDGGYFESPNDLVIDVNSAQIGGGVFLRDGFTAKGRVSLRAVDIAGNLYLNGGAFEGDGCVLDLTMAAIRRNLVLRQPKRTDEKEKTYPPTQIKGLLDLTGASCKSLHDDALSATDKDFKIRLNEFRYETIVGPSDARRRTAWLGRSLQCSQSQEFETQPFEQLVVVLRSMSFEEDARKIAILKRTKLRSAQLSRAIRASKFDSYKDCFNPWKVLTRLGVTSSAYGRYLSNILFQLTLGFGYRPYRAIFLSMFFVLLGSIFFQHVYRSDVMVPNNAMILRSDTWQACSASASVEGSSAAECYIRHVPDYPRFRAVPYSLDVFLPFFDLYQQSQWIPQPSCNSGTCSKYDLWCRGSLIYFWIHTALGYFLSALAVASFTGVVKKD